MNVPQNYFTANIYNQGMTPIAKIAIAISILIKFEIAIAIWKKIADRDPSLAIADCDRDHFTYC